ncbi:hypothetical protein AAG570_005757 [Ranatra chinensis]|uniref:Uncharacterized protein n=1 Tax=Ranatra chinensis TaxID=642074 RepID=A0ABD0XZB1_9HEMI
MFYENKKQETTEIGEISPRSQLSVTILELTPTPSDTEGGGSQARRESNVSDTFPSGSRINGYSKIALMGRTTYETGEMQDEIKREFRCEAKRRNKTSKGEKTENPTEIRAVSCGVPRTCLELFFKASEPDRQERFAGLHNAGRQNRGIITQVIRGSG